MTDLAPVPDEPDEPEPPPAAPDRYDGLPESWSVSAKETCVLIEQKHGDDIEPEVAAAVWECAALVALADSCAEQIARDGLMIRGSRSMVANPLVAEERHARTAAISALKALGLGPSQSASSAAGAALVAKRWHGRTPGRRYGA